MTRIILLSFVALGYAFYFLSGGRDFEPASASRADNSEMRSETSEAPDVSRVSLDLTPPGAVSSRISTEPTRLPQTGVPSARAPVPSSATVAPAPRTDGRITSSNAPSVDTDGTSLPSLVFGAAPDRSPEPAPRPNTLVIEAQTDTGQNQSRLVTADLVNVRSGPGITFPVVGQMLRGDLVEILETEGSGWVRFRGTDVSLEGWMSEDLLGRP